MSDGCSNLGNFWTKVKTASAEAKKFVCQLSRLDDVMMMIFSKNSLNQNWLFAEQSQQNNGIELIMDYVGKNDPAMNNILQKLFAIYQKLKHIKFIYNAAYKCFLSASLAYSVILLAKRSGISYKTVLNIMEFKKSSFFVGHIANLLTNQFSIIKNFGWKNNAKDEDNQNEKKWIFNKINDSSSLLENLLSPNNQHEKLRRRRKRRRHEIFVLLSLVAMLGLILLLRGVILFLAERHRRYATFGAQNFTLSSEVGEAHMAAFSELDEIIVGSGTSDALQQNDAQSCVICLGEIETGTVIKQLPCNHTFHTECIKTWLKGYNNFCPMCRRKIFTEYENGKVGPNTQQNQYGTFDTI
ncbi:hypothetical protein GPALN_004210 [Globodera pallida]|nr:hypothetical protein GPALN_004210 [Globodera pallida]